MSTTRDTLRKAIEAYTAEGPNDGPNDGPEEKALVELLDAIQAYDDTRESPVGPHWSRVMAAIPVFLTASADQVRDLRVAWEAFEDTEPRPPGCKCQWEAGDGPCPVHGEDEDPAERKPVAGWVHGRARSSIDLGWMDVVVLPIGPKYHWFLRKLAFVRSGDEGDADSLEAAQFAAEDALRAIADQIYAALRGGQT